LADQYRLKNQNEETLNLKVDKERAELVFGRLLDSFFRKEYPFNLPKAKAPQVMENLRDLFVLGSREHACFLFALCYWMRGGIDSQTATKQLAQLYRNNPEMFLPEKVYKFQRQMILPGLERRFAPIFLSSEFKAIGLGFNVEEIADIWVENWLRIKDLWAGDPRDIFKGVSTYEEACKRVQNKSKRGFHGFQEKMVSMLIYFYMDADILDRWHFPIPVDFHVLRIVFSNCIIVAKPAESNGNGFYTKSVLMSVRKLCQNYCVKHNVDPLHLCEAIWLYSRLMCNQHPGNQSVVGGRHGRKTELLPVSRWSLAQIRNYSNTCAICSINDTCKWCIPSAEYYIRGKLVLREERGSPPQLNFFLSST